jgi:uncharacterized protein (TIGR02600 family)
MKMNPDCQTEASDLPSRGRKSSAFRRRRGVALVLVLAVLGLLMILILAILNMARVESRGGHLTANAIASQGLVDTSINLVVSQVRAATRGLGSTDTWASQPGMVRRYSNSGAAGSGGRAALFRGYKLYSSPDMVVESDWDPDGEMPPADWVARPSDYADLNRPRNVSRVNGSTQWVFPIIDPRVTDEPDTPVRERIEGFDYETSIAGANKGSIRDDRRLPMPVRWLYQLRDGTLGHLEGNGRFIGTGGERASATNPIKGRIAFWADDETSKINTNTASESFFWDHPVGNTRMERGNAANFYTYPTAPFGYASSMPVRGEFNRYPGHPAETSLSPVFGGLLPRSPAPTVAELAPYYLMLPRTVLGGSMGGNVMTKDSAYVAPDGDRLFATANELVFRPSTLGATRRFESVGGGASSLVARSKGFLTSQSRAPELNLFNRPRVALWPLYQKSTDPARGTRRNVIENLIAFAAAPGKHDYFFQRHSEAGHPSNAWGSGMSTTLDFSVSRNQEMLAYLDKLTSTTVPGFPGNFREKYGQADQTQMLVNIFDMLRSSVNTFSLGLPPGHQFVPPYGWGIGEFCLVPLVQRNTGTNPAVMKGFGMNPTVTEVALVLYATELESVADPTQPIDPQNLPRATKVQAFLLFETFKARPGMPHQSPGLEIQVEGLENWRLDGKDMRFPAKASTYIDLFQHAGGWGSFTSHSPVLLQLHVHGGAKYGPADPTNTSVDYRRHGMVSQIIDLGGAKDQISFTGGEITVRLKTHPRSGRNEEFQKLTLNFDSSVTWPVPRSRVDGALPRSFNQRAPASVNPGNAPRPSDPLKWNEATQLLGYERDYRQIIIEHGDVVRSVQIDPLGPTRGDYRLVAGRYEVPSDWFSLHPRYHESGFTNRDAHTLRDDRFSGLGMLGFNGRNDTPAIEISTGESHRPSNAATSGKLVAGANYSNYAVPITAPGLSEALMVNPSKPGDWETGLGILPDGPFVRRNFEASNRDDGAHIHADSSYYVYGYYYSDGTGIDFAPNRQIASAVVFGGMPTGIWGKSAGFQAPRPWQTLLFCPNPASRTAAALGSEPGFADHPGFSFPRDHLLLDLFWMPAVEPYALSEPLSTAGKINMNYEMMPFRHVKRRTAMVGALKSLRVTAIPLAAAGAEGSRPGYKEVSTTPWEFRYEVNTSADRGTLRGFEDRFEKGDIFRSASEICEIYLVPKKMTQLPPGSRYPEGSPSDPDYNSMAGWWSNFKLTGDNAREMPYNHLYPRLTTKSNTFRVHYRVQVLAKSRGSNPEIWDEERDRVVAEKQGQTLVERFVNTDGALPDFAKEPLDEKSVEDYYQWRVVESAVF